jgi:hypothetical protein
VRRRGDVHAPGGFPASQSTGVIPGPAADLIEGVSRPPHHMEGVGDPNRVGTGLGHDGVDEVRAVGRDMSDLRTALGAQEVKEPAHRGAVAARRGPHQPAGVVIDDDHQILVTVLVADLVDPDPA